MGLTFIPPVDVLDPTTAIHHGTAAAGNFAAATDAICVLHAALERREEYERILLRAAAGAGKSHLLKRMVDEALQHAQCRRVGVTAFANKQIFPLAEDLGRALGKDQVCLYVSKDRVNDVAQSVRDAATVVSDMQSIPASSGVVLATSHMLMNTGPRLFTILGSAYDAEHLFDVLFVDEAWQMPLYLYRRVASLAPISVGVGDVGQLPPLDPGQNPWRGDPGYNPFRAWPTAYESDAHTWSRELPAVWRPHAHQLPLWRAFYPDWDQLHCVAAAEDRTIELGSVDGDAASVWEQVATGVPTLVELYGLPEADAPDIDPPLLAAVEQWLDRLLAAGFRLYDTQFDPTGVPSDRIEINSASPAGRVLIAVLATRNQAVDDAQAMVERLIARHDLEPGSIVASTVDSWQGQTNAITVAIHPLSGASALDDFNSAFGRLAVTCTRATHGLLLVARAGLDKLLNTAPARPGTPLGEPGPRQLPRQTHQRILDSFAQARSSA